MAVTPNNLELAGPPRRWLNNTLSGFASLPLRLSVSPQPALGRAR
jgi:hypothetical protein